MSRNGRKSFVDRIFPLKYDFHKMLQDQASETVLGVQALVDWLKEGALSEPKRLVEIEERADGMRHDMEHLLTEAFSTPFDRQDIYSISRQMDYILNWSVSTAEEMRAFGVRPDAAIMVMAEVLLRGTGLVLDSVKLIGSDPKKAEGLIPQMRDCEHEIERVYVKSMAEMFQSGEMMTSLKKREIYHHLRDAGRNLSITVDILHRIVVGVI